MKKQNLCKLCQESIGTVMLIRKQQVTDSDWIIEYYHEQCWFEHLFRLLNYESPKRPEGII